MIAADLVLGELAPPRFVVGALALGTTIGQSVVAVPLVIVTRRIRGPAAVHGVGRATLAGLAGGVLGTAVGLGIAVALPPHGKVLASVVAVLAAACSVLAFGVVAYLLDRGDTRVAMHRAMRLIQSRRSSQLACEDPGR